MALTNNLEILVPEESQARKALVVAEALNALEKCISGIYTYEITGQDQGNPQTTTHVLPYDNLNELSDRDALRFITLRLTGATYADFIVEHPSNPHLFIVVNETAHSAVLRVTGRTNTVTVPSGRNKIVMCDGTDMQDMTLSLAAPVAYTGAYDLSFTMDVQGPPGTVVGKMLIGRDCLIPADFAGTTVYSLAPAAGAEVKFAVYVDNVKVGNFSSFRSTSTPGSKAQLFLPATNNNADVAITAGSLLELRLEEYSADENDMPHLINIPATVMVAQV